MLALPPERRKRVLLLGLGGGSVARILRALAPDASIVGVEFDPEVLAAAYAHFDLRSLGLEVVEGDALEVLQRENRFFDLVVDDVFLGSYRKPAWIPRPGLELALCRLCEGGLLVSNTVGEARRVAASLRAQRPGLLRIDVRDYENRVLVAGPARLDARSLRRAVRASPVLAGSLPLLRFRNARRPR